MSILLLLLLLLSRFSRVNAILLSHPALAFPLCVHILVLYVCVSIAALEICSSVQLFF